MTEFFKRKLTWVSARPCRGPDRAFGAGGPWRLRRLEFWPVRGRTIARNHFHRADSRV